MTIKIVDSSLVHFKHVRGYRVTSAYRLVNTAVSLLDVGHLVSLDKEGLSHGTWVHLAVLDARDQVLLHCTMKANADLSFSAIEANGSTRGIALYLEANADRVFHSARDVPIPKDPLDAPPLVVAEQTSINKTGAWDIL